MKIENINIEWLGHASFKISNSKIIYIDPWKIKNNDKADLILITHEHYDHFSLADIQKLIGDNTIIVAPEYAAPKIIGNVKTIRPREKLNIKGIEIEAVRAYNINKKFHPIEKDYIGYIINLDNTKVYHSGDTDLIPEMRSIKTDIALLPVGGTYTMTAEEAANAANIINPKVAIPMHFGDIIGTREDAEKFKSLCKCKVEIL